MEATIKTPEKNKHKKWAKYQNKIVRIVRVRVEPNEVAPIPLLFYGLGLKPFVQCLIDGSFHDLDGRTNKTEDVLFVWHGYWEQTGKDAGWFLDKHLEMLPSNYGEIIQNDPKYISRMKTSPDEWV